MANQTTTLATLKTWLRTVVGDTASPQYWTDTELTTALNLAQYAAAPLGEYGYERHYSRPMGDEQFRIELTTSDIAAVTGVWYATQHRPTRSVKLRDTDYDVSWTASETVVIGVHIPETNAPPAYPVIVDVLYRKAPTLLSGDSSTTALPPLFLVHYAASILWSNRAARSEPLYARFCHQQAQWQMALAQNIKQALTAGHPPDKEA